MDCVGIEPVHRCEHRGVRIHGGVHLTLREISFDPLRPAGGSRRIQHVSPTRLRVEWSSGLRIDRFFVVVEALEGAAVHQSVPHRSEEHTSELQSLMRISYAVFCLNKKNKKKITN